MEKRLESKAMPIEKGPSGFHLRFKPIKLGLGVASALLFLNASVLSQGFAPNIPSKPDQASPALFMPNKPAKAESGHDVARYGRITKNNGPEIFGTRTFDVNMRGSLLVITMPDSTVLRLDLAAEAPGKFDFTIREIRYFNDASGNGAYLLFPCGMARIVPDESKNGTYKSFLASKDGSRISVLFDSDAHAVLASTGTEIMFMSASGAHSSVYSPSAFGKLPIDVEFSSTNTPTQVMMKAGGKSFIVDTQLLKIMPLKTSQK